MPKKATQEKATQEQVGTKTRRNGYSMTGTIRKMVLASVGAVGVAQNEVDSLVRRMVERGEMTEREARKLISDTRKEVARRRKRPVRNIESELEGMLEKMNIPSKADVEDLSKQIANLSRRIEELKNELNKRH